MSDIPPPDDDLDAAPGDFDNFEEKKAGGTLGDLWRDNAMFKVGVVVVAAVAIFGAIILFGGPSEKPQLSITPDASEVVAAPGTEEASPAYVDAVKEQNEKRTEEAQKNGTSSLPTPIEPPVGRLAVPEEEATNEDPLQRWRKLQEERLERELQKTQGLAPENAQQDANRQQEIQALSSQMQAQMQAILDSKGQNHINYRSFTPPSWLEQKKQKEEDERKKALSEMNDAQNKNPDGTPKTDDAQIIILPAGEIEYAQLITEANSDAQGPVLAQIAGGPMNGARILGKFNVTENDMLTLNFDTAVVDGISYSINAIALDPKTTLPALRSSVDHHYLSKVALPMASSFIQGFAQALSQSGRTTVSISNSGGSATGTTTDATDKQQIATGVDKAGQTVSQFLDDMNAKIKTTVVLKSGTPIGLLFTDPVIQSNDNIKLKSAPDQPQSPLAGFNPYSVLPGQQSATTGGAAGQYPAGYPAPYGSPYTGGYPAGYPAAAIPGVTR